MKIFQAIQWMYFSMAYSLDSIMSTDIPITVVIPEGDGTGVITVCANDLNNCCDEVVIELINCETPECSIFEFDC